MTKTLKKLRAVVFAGGIGSALAFGTATLRADVSPTAACADPFATSCTTTAACAKYCRTVEGAGTGQCSSGCCYCIWF